MNFSAISDLGLLALGLQRVPARPEGAVVGVEHGGEGHLDLAEEIVGEVLVLVGDAYEELLLEVPDPEGELLVPHGVGRLPDHLGLGPLPPQLQLGVRVAQPLRLRRREVAGLDDMHHKPHFLFFPFSVVVVKIDLGGLRGSNQIKKLRPLL